MVERKQSRIALIVAASGLALMIYMIIFEDEPGGIPLILIVVGTLWYFYDRRQALRD